MSNIVTVQLCIGFSALLIFVAMRFGSIEIRSRLRLRERTRIFRNDDSSLIMGSGAFGEMTSNNLSKPPYLVKISKRVISC